MYLDKQHPKPVYLQLKDMLQRKIEQGNYVSHQQLPSERNLCQHFKLSRMTVRKALKALITDGYAYTRAGKGTFVSDLPGKASKSQPGALSFTGLSDWHTTYPHNWQKLIDPLLAFDCVGVEQAISEVLAAHSVEAVANELFPAIIKYLEQQWQAGNVGLPVHNYAITTVRSQLIAMVNATPMADHGPKILLGCTPEDQHEIGLLLLALNLRRRGYLVIYIGPNLTLSEFRALLETGKPQIVCLSAATDQAVLRLKALASQCLADQAVAVSDAEMLAKPKPWLTFGGVIFRQKPDLVMEVPGIYLGNSVNEAVERIQRLRLM